MAKKKEVSEKKRNKVNKKDDLSKYIPSDYEKPLGIEFSKKETSDKKTNQDGYDEIHGSLYKMTHNNTIPWRNYLVYAVLLTFLTCAFTFSKYASQLTSTDSKATVAGFSYSINYVKETGFDTDIQISGPESKLDSTPSIDFTDINSKKYKFKVSNSSDVTVKVTPFAELGGTAPASDGGDFAVTFNNPITIEAGKDGYVIMTIDSSNIKKTLKGRTLSLKFVVEQVD